MMNENINKKVKKWNTFGHDKYISKLLNYFAYIFPFDNKQQLINDSVNSVWIELTIDWVWFVQNFVLQHMFNNNNNLLTSDNR